MSHLTLSWLVGKFVPRGHLGQDGISKTPASPLDGAGLWICWSLGVEFLHWASSKPTKTYGPGGAPCGTAPAAIWGQEPGQKTKTSHEDPENEEKVDNQGTGDR